jgi:hypothetical protein
MSNESLFLIFTVTLAQHMIAFRTALEKIRRAPTPQKNTFFLSYPFKAISVLQQQPNPSILPQNKNVLESLKGHSQLYSS